AHRPDDPAVRPDRSDHGRRPRAARPAVRGDRAAAAGQGGRDPPPAPATPGLARALLEHQELIGPELEAVFERLEADHPELSELFERKILQFRAFAPPPHSSQAAAWEAPPAAAAAST